MPVEQPDLTGATPNKFHPNNLPSRLVDKDGIVVVFVWLQYNRSGESIGDCRGCGGGMLVAERPESHGNRTDYTATCGGPTGCGKEVVFPGGRTGRWLPTEQRGKKRRLPQGMVGIAKNAAGVGQSSEDGE